MHRRHLLARSGPDTGDAGAGPELTLLVRSWCSLCDAMRAALAPVAARHAVRVVEVDLDAHPEWEERYGERVPALFIGTPADGREIAALTLDPQRVSAALAEVQVAVSREIR